MLTLNRIDIMAYSHATEDVNKVLKAILNLIPPDLRDRVRVSRQDVKGHYGNVITILKITIPSNEAVKVLEYIASKMPDAERGIIRASLRLRYDRRGHKLYLRFDKQALYNDKLMISDGDDIVRVIIGFSGKGGIQEVKGLLKKYGLI